MTAGFYTLGCKLNQFETESIADAFKKRGFAVIPALRNPAEEADVYIINTCTVTTKSEQKARRVIRKILDTHPASHVIVTGCYAQVDSEALQKLSARIIVLPQEKKYLLLKSPEGEDGAAFESWLKTFVRSGREIHTTDPFAYEPASLSFHTRAFLKIQDGCDNFCSYCRVPFARGQSVSCPSSRVLEAAAEFEARGYKEIVLTGVNISDYRDGGLHRLLADLLRKTPNVRYRLSSLEPDGITEALLEILKNPAICPHFHLPLQSGSDRVLRQMRRNYTRDLAAKVVTELRTVKDDPFMAADVIAGFPGETEEDFRDTLSLLESLGLSKLHAFPYSKRPGTAAAGFPDQLPSSVITGRTRDLLVLSEQLYHRYMRRWVWKKTEVLIQETPEDGEWIGLSSNYLPVRIKIPAAPYAVKPGIIVPVTLEALGVAEMAGKIDKAFTGST